MQTPQKHVAHASSRSFPTEECNSDRSPLIVSQAQAVLKPKAVFDKFEILSHLVKMIRKTVNYSKDCLILDKTQLLPLGTSCTRLRQWLRCQSKEWRLQKIPTMWRARIIINRTANKPERSSVECYQLRTRTRELRCKRHSMYWCSPPSTTKSTLCCYSAISIHRCYGCK